MKKYKELQKRKDPNGGGSAGANQGGSGGNAGSGY